MTLSPSFRAGRTARGSRRAHHATLAGLAMLAVVATVLSSAPRAEPPSVRRRAPMEIIPAEAMTPDAGGAPVRRGGADDLAAGAAATPRPSAITLLPSIFLREHPLELTTDAGDVFYVHGEAIPLRRSQHELAVGWRPGVTARSRPALASLLPAALDAIPLETLRDGRAELVQVSEVPGRAGSLRQPPLESALAALRAHRDVAWAYPALVNPESGFRFLPTPEILVALADDGRAPRLADLETAFGIEHVKGEDCLAGDWRMFRLVDPARQDPVAIAARLNGVAGVAWAEPHWQMQIELAATPNDPFFPIQWEHLNLGLGGSLAGADPDTSLAWDVSYGSPSITVAVVDSGIQTNHPDLAANMWNNPGETPGNGLDDDGNGFIDDVFGWDFFSGDNDPNPSMNASDSEGHGMGSAGIVAAVINNGVGTAGTANVKVMALRITNDSSFASNAVISNAINYAWQNGADIQSHSWGTPLSSSSSSTALDNAIANSVTNGRGGKGTAVFFATGNAASQWNYGGLPLVLPFTGLTNNVTYRMGVRITRVSTQGGTQIMGVDNIVLPDYSRHSFEPTAPAGWVKEASTTFALANTGASGNQTATLSNNSLVNPTLSNGQSADLVSPAFLNTLAADNTSFLQFSLRQSAPRAINGTARLNMFLDFYQTSGTPTRPGNHIGSLNLSSLVDGPTTNANVSWPASNANSIAVGASTDWDDRSDYSQFGSNLDFVVSSNGGWNPTWSVDSTGAAGWVDGDTKDFGGTSSACPKAAAIGALVLSRYPSLTAAQLRNVLRHTADKVHSGTRYTYNSSGFNSEMGYGRLNANRAVRFAGPSWNEADSTMFTMAGTDMQSITSQPIDVSLANRSDAGVLLLAIFDGDSGGGPSGWTSGHWDYSTQTVSYQLFADPNKTGSGMTLLQTFNSASLPDNDWFVTTIANAASAQNANGHYYYRLRVSPASWSGLWANSFKIGSNAQKSIPAGYYIFQNALYTQGDLAVVYPNYVGPDNPGAPSVDPTIRLFPYYPTAPTTVTVWDCDFDYGGLNWGAGATPPSVANPDTNDPNTAPGDRPPGFLGTTMDEGVQSGTVIKNGTPYTLFGVGNPPDNERRAFRRVDPAVGANVTYAVRLPGVSTEVWNLNPSGDSEWERFVLSAGANAGADFASLGAMGAGFARITVSGLDWSNIVGFYLERETFFDDATPPLGNVTSP